MEESASWETISSSTSQGFLSLKIFHTDSGPTQPLFLRLKRPELETNHSPPSSAKGKDEWSYNSAPAVFRISLTHIILSLNEGVTQYSRAAPCQPTFIAIRKQCSFNEL